MLKHITLFMVVTVVFSVSLLAQPPATAEPPKFVIFPMFEGDLSIKGSLKNFGENTEFVILRNSGKEIVQLDPAGKFDVTLKTTALIANEKIRFLLPGSSTTDDTILAVSERLPTPGQEGDLGFGRYYFTGGTIISKKNDFQGADVYAAFNFDKTWIALRAEKDKFRWIQLNSYFDARLTSIPIAQGSGVESSVPPAAGTPEPSTEALIAQSKKAAILQIGLYAPIIVTQKVVGGQANAMFAAPLAKAGVQTVTGTNTTAEGASLGGDDLYNFSTYGFRLGQFRKTETSSTPQIVWYLDAAWGHFENFELCEISFTDASGNARIAQTICPETLTDGSNGTLSMRRFRPIRTSIEGRLKIPGLPLIVGFDVNAGKGPDDVRFLFGTRFDIGELARKIH